tara:strand:+ start:207 stop:560 length:354 start_codon:yes stop_codon:yes gene_type:complete
MKRLLLVPLLFTLLVSCSNANKKELMKKYPLNETVEGSFFNYRFRGCRGDICFRETLSKKMFENPFYRNRVYDCKNQRFKDQIGLGDDKRDLKFYQWEYPFPDTNGEAIMKDICSLR